jgi:hypothetical protein
MTLVALMGIATLDSSGRLFIHDGAIGVLLDLPIA